MDVHPTSAWEVKGFYAHLVIYESIHPTSVPVHLNIPASKTGALQKGLKKQNSDFLENF
jgi:hypothetical protein